jgi:hypothetical protein
MALTIHNTVESKRGCGYRRSAKGGVGIYLMGGKLSAPCGRLPVPLVRCPTCDSGIKPSRSWTWIEPAGLFAKARAKPCEGSKVTLAALGPNVKQCALCPLGDALPLGKHGLIWIGEKFYASAHDFVKEAAALGVSRKVPALPRGFELGKTWVYLAHRAAVQQVIEGEPLVQAGVFTAFLPTRVDLVVDTDDPAQLPERAVKLAEELGEGCRLVKVTRDCDTQLTLDDAAVSAQAERATQAALFKADMLEAALRASDSIEEPRRSTQVDFEIIDPDTTDPRLRDAIERLDAKVAANPNPQFVRHVRDVGAEDGGEDQDFGDDVPDEDAEEWEP